MKHDSRGKDNQAWDGPRDCLDLALGPRGVCVPCVNIGDAQAKNDASMILNVMLDKPGKQLRVVLCIIAYIALGVPVWWQTTKIQRPVLPHVRMQGASALIADFKLPVHLTLHIAFEVLQDILTVHVVSEGGRCSAATWPVGNDDSGVTADCHAQSADMKGGGTAAGGDFTGELCCIRQVGKEFLHLSEQEADAAWHAHLKEQGLQMPGSYHIIAMQAAAAAVAQQTHLSTAPEPGTSAGRVCSQVPRLVVGQHRGAFLWLPCKDQHDSADTLFQEQLLHALYAVAPAIRGSFLAHAGPQAAATAGQQPLSAAGEAVLSFTLCNAEPARQYNTWDFAAFERQYLAPVLAALSPVVQLSVQSQVLLYARSKQNGSWSAAHDAFVVQHGQLPDFVDSHWNLDTGGLVISRGVAAASGTAASRQLPSSRDAQAAAHPLVDAAGAAIPKHVLHFVAYVPPSDQQPLAILLPEGKPSPTNSYSIPSWGGLHIINPSTPPQQQQQQQQGPEDRQRCSSGVPGLCAHATSAAELGPAVMARFGRIFVSQLRQLLGLDLQEQLLDLDLQEQLLGLDLQEQLLQRHAPKLRSTALGEQMGSEDREVPPDMPISPAASFSLEVLSARTSGFAEWELDALMRQRAAYNAATSAQVLASLSRLVEQLPSLEMPDLIGDQVEAALLALKAVVSHAGNYSEACASAQAARTYAEAAFSNPAVLAQLSFPPSHLIGVYMPFFLPLAMSVVQALVSEVLRYRAEVRKQLVAN